MTPFALTRLIPWLALALGELIFAAGAYAPPTPGQVFAELTALLLFGAITLRFSRGELASSALPGVLVVAGTGLALRPAGWVHGFTFAIGVIVLAAVAVRVIEERLRPGPFLGSILAILGTILARFIVLGASDVQDSRAELLAELRDPFPRAAAPKSAGPPLILITVDTLRWDHAAEMKSVQRLAARGRSWPRAMSTSSWTLPAMASVFTGQGAESHGAGAWPDQGYSGLSADTPTLPERFAAAGYTTAAFASNPFLTQQMGFGRGFDLFFHSNERVAHRLLFAGFPAGPREWESEVVLGRAMRWLQSAPESGYFLWIHLLDAHLPYRHLPPGSPIAGWRSADVRDGLIFTEAQRGAMREGYAAEVAHVDAKLLQLLDLLESRGVLDRGVLLLTADHGEELWDHGFVEHGHSHHGEVVDVPLVLVAPGLAPGAGQGLASLTDVAPTLIAAAGLADSVGTGLDLRQGAPAERVVVAYGNKYDRVDRSGRQGEARVIARGDGQESRYDLRIDPQERDPFEVLPDDPVARVLRELEVASPSGSGAVSVDALRALGYVD